MHKTAAIILAAGLSRRMGTQNKLLLPIGGLPMVRRVVSQYIAALCGPVTVVTGHEAAQVEDALAGLNVTCTYHAGFAQGQQSSVAFGLQNCPQADVVLIGLADQPLLRSTDIQALLAAHRSAQADKVSIPVTGDARGNPIIVPDVLRGHLTANPERPGCMRFTRDNPDLVQRHRLSRKGFYADVDTPAAYAKLQQHEVQDI